MHLTESVLPRKNSLYTERNIVRLDVCDRQDHELILWSNICNRVELNQEVLSALNVLQKGDTVCAAKRILTQPTSDAFIFPCPMSYTPVPGYVSLQL